MLKTSKLRNKAEKREGYSVGLTTEQTDIYILIGKSWTKKVKKYFFGNFFWTVPF